MAIYHFSMSNISRAKGSAATATLSYITGRKVKDERTGLTFYGFGRTERIQMTGTVLPDNAPQQFQDDPAVMINKIELYEKSERARPAKKIEVALPRELTPDQQKKVIESFILKNLAVHGYGAVYAVHDDLEHKNPHAHILVPNRQMNDRGWARSKCRKEYVLDDKGERVPIIDTATGQQKTDKRGRKQWKRVTVEANLLDQRSCLTTMRESWAQECNRYLSPDHQIDHRSLKEQGDIRIPTVHEGYAAREIHSRGGTSNRILVNDAIRSRNSLLVELKEVAEKLTELAKERGNQIHERIENLLARRNRATAGSGREAPDGERNAEAEELLAQAGCAIAERTDRELEQERSRIEALRKAEARRRKRKENREEILR